MIELRHITKRFGGVPALEDLSLEVRPGERLALIGENGAGKSSLMNVLYGLYQPDAGEVCFDGQPVRVKTPAEALARGVGMVHQHFTLVPTLTVTENVVLGHEPTTWGRLDNARAQQEVAATCAKFGFQLDVSAVVRDLSVGSQQKVEIVKALHRGVKTLILDEPTAVLTPQEADELFAVTRRLSEEGLAVVLISHKLREVLSFSTRIAVMRRGKKVGETTPGQTSREQLAELMIGPKVPSSHERGEGQGEGPNTKNDLVEASELIHQRSQGYGLPAINLKDFTVPPEIIKLVPRELAEKHLLVPVNRAGSALILAMSDPANITAVDELKFLTGFNIEAVVANLPDIREAIARYYGQPSPHGGKEALVTLDSLTSTGLHGVSLSIRSGEILGIAGVDGNGQRELAEVLTGLRHWTGGTFSYAGTQLSQWDPGTARELGVAHIPEDRLRRAMISELTVEENVSLGRQRRAPFAKGPRIDFAGRRASTTALLEANDVRPRDPLVRAGGLSGGNQQKLVVGRELDAAPKLLVVVQPTRGLDIAAVAAVREKLRAQRARACAVLLVSLDLDEVLELSDRVVVLCSGRVTGEFARSDFDERLIGKRMLGVLDA